MDETYSMNLKHEESMQNILACPLKPGIIYSEQTSFTMLGRKKDSIRHSTQTGNGVLIGSALIATSYKRRTEEVSLKNPVWRRVRILPP
jgi:hypothetical protein